MIDYVKQNINFDFKQIPPAYRQNFKHEFNPRAVSPQPVIKGRNRNRYTDQDQHVMEFLFINTFATETQLRAYLQITAPAAQKQLHQRLQDLVHENMINSFTLTALPQDTVLDDMLVIYTLDFGGKALLTNYSELNLANWYSTVNLQNSIAVAMNLYETQFYLCLLQTLRKNQVASTFLAHYQSNPQYREKGEKFSLNCELLLHPNQVEYKYLLGDIVYPQETFYFNQRAANVSELLHTKSWLKYFSLAEKPPLYMIILPDFEQDKKDVAQIILKATKFTPQEIIFIDGAQLDLTHNLDDPGFYQILNFDREQADFQYQYQPVALDIFKA